MPDIVSRIRLEAQGADQAAREIRKLKEAYDQVSQAAKGLSPSGVAGADPFAQATAAPGGAVIGGQRPSEVAERENRNRAYREQVRDRETANASFNQTMRQVPGQVGGVFQTVEAAAQGRGGGAVGGLLQGAGAFLGGPLGLMMLAGGAGAVGVQRFAENAFGRLQQIWGSGMAQRLGQTYRPMQELITGFARTGVPMEMITGFFNAASRAGMTMDEAMLPATQMAMEAMAMTGIDPGQMGAMMGALSRAGIGGLGANYNLFSMMKGTFGQANMGTFVQEITRATETAMRQGIDVNQEEAVRQANLIGAYSQFGGLTPTGAAALSQMTIDRGRQAAALQRPEDIIAFQMMRKAAPEMSASEVMMAMEESPTEVNRRVYEYLKGATGGDQDLLRFRMRQYLGPGATMSQVDAMIRTFENRGDITAEERNQLAAGLTTEAWMGRTWDEEKQQYVSASKERQVFAVRQLEALQGVQNSALDITTAIGELGKLLTGDVKLDALTIGFEGYRPDLSREIREAEARVQNVTRQDVSAAYVELEAQNVSMRETRRALSFLEDPRIATSMASGAEMRRSPELMAYFRERYGMAGMGREFGFFERGEQPSLGPWAFMVSELASGYIERAREQAREDVEAEGGSRREQAQAVRELDQSLAALSESIIRLSEQDLTLAEAINTLDSVLVELQKRGFVYTDGGE